METDTKYYSNKQNAVRAARKVLGAEAKPHVDFYLLGGNTHWQWQIRDLGPMAEVTAAVVEVEHAAATVDPMEIGADLEPACTAAYHAPVVEARAERRERPNKVKDLGVPPILERKPRAPNAGLVTLVEFMKRPEGTTLAEAQAATGWLPHTIRSRIAVDVVRKQGHKVERVRKDGASVYRIVE